MDKAQLRQIEIDFLKIQKETCERFDAPFLAAPFDKLIGIAIESFDNFTMPINGLRHPIENERSANW